MSTLGDLLRTDAAWHIAIHAALAFGIFGAGISFGRWLERRRWWLP